MKKVGMIIVVMFGLWLAPLNEVELDDFKSKTITVSIQGEVVEEKVLELDVYSTLQTALQQVNLTSQADTRLLNPQMILNDQDVIVVPKMTEEKKISINHATKEELMNIKGIGERKAEQIIEYRLQHGYFQTLEQLMEIPGIKQKTFDQLKDFICL